MANCSAKVTPRDSWGSFHQYQCKNRGSIEVEGKLYCKIHDPARVKAKREESDKLYQEHQEKLNQEWARRKAEVAACEGVITELLTPGVLKELLKYTGIERISHAS